MRSCANKVPNVTQCICMCAFVPQKLTLQVIRWSAIVDAAHDVAETVLQRSHIQSVAQAIAIL